ncbi:MAG: GreA/GreB family elongation factor [Patescibacteria group bacterium]
MVDPPQNAITVTIGTRVTILRDGEQATWEIVGHGESDPDRELIAYNTPLALLLMEKRIGDCVEGIIAGKRVWIKIIEITLGGGDENTE